MNKKPLLIFDLDDTLIDTSDAFFQCRSKFIEYIKAENLVPDLVCLFEQQDSDSTKLFGYAPWRYSFTMAWVYLSLVTDKVIDYSAEDMVRVVNIGRQIEMTVPQLRVGARETLAALAKIYRLALLTRGSESLQLRKVQEHGLEALFEHISVIQRKTTQSFRDVLTAVSARPKDAWSIGDSPKWDIMPAKEAGLKTILVKYEHPSFSWGHEKRDLSLPEDTLVAQRLEDIPQLVKDHTC